MKKYTLLLLIGFCPYVLAERIPLYEEYIAQYRAIALEHQQTFRIPASITLAQALLESGAGRGELALQANNHFGIKCNSNWTGATYRHDDDALQECFRKYLKVEDSFVDHARFLQRPRYESLFALPVTDYKGWAEGLSRCGYATDPKYPEKLIRLIEEYELDKLAQDTPAQIQVLPSDTVRAADTVDVNPAPQLQELTAMQDVELFYDHAGGTQNGVRYIVAKGGETFASLSYQLNTSEKLLRRFNDATDGRELRRGDRVYLYPKKAKADRAHARYYVRTGDSAWSISQQFGMKMATIYKLNGIPAGTPLVTRQELILR